ncbi:MAG TPA: ThiF family adenylyltransferase [Planctomycetota bacterium]
MKDKKIAVCGAGAVGSTLADSLARQGVGHLRVIDFDRVEARNLATQTYTTEDVGALKVQALKDQIFRAAGVEIDAVPKKLTPENAAKLLKDVDLVIDGFDNSAARRAVTTACASTPCLHVGLFAGYGEARWNEGYRVPNDPAEGDPCDVPLARNLIQLTCAVAAELALRFLRTGAKESRSITLGDLRINPEEA